MKENIRNIKSSDEKDELSKTIRENRDIKCLTLVLKHGKIGVDVIVVNGIK